METIFRITLFLAGIINIIPSFLAIFPEKIAKSYGIEVPDVNYELLLRHRAVLFGIIGGLLLFSAISKKYYEVALVSGLVSMISFILLYFLVGDGINAELKKVMIADLVASIVLIIGVVCYYFSSKSTTA